MAFVKGDTRINKSGRPKGALNRSTEMMKLTIARAVDNTLNTLSTDLEKIKKKDPERAMIWYTCYGKNSILGVKDCGYYDYPAFTPKDDKRKKIFIKKPGWGHLFTSTKGSMSDGGAVFIYRTDTQAGVEDVRYGFYPVRPIRKNI